MNNKKVALITGAAGGIGRELCLKFYQLNYLIAGLDKNRIKLESLLNDFGFDPQRFLGIEVDITIPTEINKAIETVKKKLGEISLVINSAGGPTSNTIAQTTNEQWNEDISLNLNSVFYLLSSVLPRMVELRNGVIINIGSVNGLSIYGHPAYSAAKAGLIHLTKFLAVEYGKHGIRTNIICPGTVKTEAWKARIDKNSNIWEELKPLYPTKSLLEPSDVAEIASFLASSSARMINGSTIIVDGGLSAGIEYIAESFMQDKF